MSKVQTALEHVLSQNITALGKLGQLATKLETSGVLDEERTEAYSSNSHAPINTFDSTLFGETSTLLYAAAPPSGSGGGKTPKNKAPVANNDDMTVAVNGTSTINVLLNDTDVNRDILSLTSIGTALHGTATFNTNGTVTYTATAGYVGFDSFTYKISDGKGGTAQATVNITVGNPNHNPDAINDSTYTFQNQSVTVNVLANDTDLDGDKLTISSLSTVKNGTVVLNSDGTVTFTPTAGFTGTGSLDYTVSDGRGGTDIATATISVQPTPPPPAPYYVQALDSGYHLPTTGGVITVTFSFPTIADSYLSTTESSTFQPFNADQQAAVRQILAAIETFTKIDFVEVTNTTGTMAFRNINEGASGAAAYAYYPGTFSPLMSDVFVNMNYSYQYSVPVGSYAYMTLIHEIGHALGLEHSFESGLMPSGEENRQYTVMSYTGAPGGLNPETMMIYDIAAIQYIYGTNTTFNTGNDTYALKWGERYAIWDAGGNDTLDGSALSGGMTISLKDGTFSSVGGSNNISIAIGAVMENANGGSANDTITGNAVANLLKGNGGDDTLSGLDGNDTLIGGSGLDTLYGGLGNDILHFDGQDLLFGGEGMDTMVALFNAIFDASSPLLNSLEKFNFLDGYNEIVNIKIGDILNLSDNDDLYVLGDASDIINLTGGSSLGQVDVGGTLYQHYTDGTSDLFVGLSVQVNQVVV